MINLLGRFDLTSDFYYGRERFYERFLPAESLSGLKSIATPGQWCFIRSEKIISCSSLSFGMDVHSVVKYQGQPNFKNKFASDSMNVLVYRHKRGGVKFTQVFYFLHDQLVYCRIFLSSKSIRQKEELKRAISFKYFGVELPMDNKDVRISDANGNKLWTSESFQFEINYSSPACFESYRERASQPSFMRLI